MYFLLLSLLEPWRKACFKNTVGGNSGRFVEAISTSKHLNSYMNHEKHILTDQVVSKDETQPAAWMQVIEVFG